MILRIHTCLLAVAPALGLMGCVSFHAGNRMALASEELGTESAYERTTKAAVELLSVEARFPSNYPSKPSPGEKPGSFDPNRLFSVLKHISMEPGFTLDYKYVIDRDSAGFVIGAYPSLYASQTQDHRPSSDSETREARADLFEHIVTDGTPESFFDLAVLRIIGNEFYVFWHDLPGRDIVPVAGKQTLRNLLTPLGLWWTRLSHSDVKPTITLDETGASVSLLTFSNWEGLYRRVLVFHMAFPHRLLHDEAQPILRYNRYTGVKF